MTDPRTQTSENTGRNVIISLVLPCLLIGQFLWNLLTPAHEYAMRSEQVMTMTLDALLLAGLFGLRRSMPAPLFWIALVAGIGLFALRMTSDAAWWTGHLVYSIQLR
jgi:hypothetical protein